MAPVPTLTFTGLAFKLHDVEEFACLGQNHQQEESIHFLIWLPEVFPFI